jgi:hypothetical protein
LVAIGCAVPVIVDTDFTVVADRGFPVGEDIGTTLTGKAFDVAVADVAGTCVAVADMDDAAALASDEKAEAVIGISVTQLMDEGELP